MKPRRFRQAAVFLLMSAAVLVMAAAAYFHTFDNYELSLLDLRFRWRPPIPTTDKIALIEIGEDTIQELGRFPFDRSYHAVLVKALSEAGARMVLIDLLFSEPQEHDQELLYALNQASNVYLPYVFDIESRKNGMVSGRGYLAKCLDGFAREAEGTGHINVVPDRDGKFRRVPLFVKYEDTFYPCVSFIMACDYLGLKLKDAKFSSGRDLRLGNDIRIPLDEGSDMMVNFAGRWGTSYRHYSYVDVIRSHFAGQSGAKPILDLAVFKDKICIVGLTATGTGDVHPNPFESIYPGMGVHAELLNSILCSRFIGRASKRANTIILLILISAASLIAFKLKPHKALPILFAQIIFFICAAFVLFNHLGLWVDVVYPAMAMAMVYLAVTFYKYVVEWKKRLVFESELDTARKIQESFLPGKLPAVRGADIAVLMSTARQVGGDLYDFVNFEGSAGKLGVMIGDVSGKGIPASLFMAMTAGSFRSFSKLKSRPDEVLSSLNSKVVEESSSNLFVTMLYAVFDMEEGCVVFSNGGHLPLLYADRSGSVQFLDVDEGVPLGIMEGPYSQRTVKFEKGDIFIFYTDGVTEAMNSSGEFYGAERLEALARSRRALTSAEMLKAIETDVRRFEPKSRQHDDITLIVVKC